MFVGQKFNEDLDWALSHRLERELTAVLAPLVPKTKERYVWKIDGNKAVSAALAAILPSAELELSDEVERTRMRRQFDALGKALEKLIPEIGDEATSKAVFQLMKMHDDLVTEIKARPPATRAVLLIPESIIKGENDNVKA